VRWGEDGGRARGQGLGRSAPAGELARRAVRTRNAPAGDTRRRGAATGEQRRWSGGQPEGRASAARSGQAGCEVGSCEGDAGGAPDCTTARHAVPRRDLRCATGASAHGRLRWALASHKFSSSASARMVAASTLLLVATAPAAMGFVMPGGGVAPGAQAGLALRGVGLGALSTHSRQGRAPALRRGAALMMSDEDEWFNPGAVAKLARSAPVTPRRPPTPVAPAPVLLEGVLDWGYYAGMSWEGRGKGTQVGGINNQDSIIASSLDNSILFGVFDGHGEYGGEASSTIVENLPTNVYEVEELIEAGGMDPARVQPPFEAAFAKTHQQLLDQQAFDTFLSGSTCITVLVGLAPLALLRSSPSHPFAACRPRALWGRMQKAGAMCVAEKEWQVACLVACP